MPELKLNTGTGTVSFKRTKPDNKKEQLNQRQIACGADWNSAKSHSDYNMDGVLPGWSLRIRFN